MANGPDILNWPRGPDAMDCASARWSAVRVFSLSLGRRGDCMSAMDVSSCKNGRAAPSLVICSVEWAVGGTIEYIMDEAPAMRYRNHEPHLARNRQAWRSKWPRTIASR